MILGRKRRGLCSSAEAKCESSRLDGKVKEWDVGLRFDLVQTLHGLKIHSLGYALSDYYAKRCVQ